MSSRTEERIKLVMALTDKILKKTRTEDVDPPPVLEVKSWIANPDLQTSKPIIDVSQAAPTNTTTASCLLTKGTSHSKILVLVIESIDDWMGYWQEVTETHHVPAPSLCLNHPYQPTPIVGGLGPSREAGTKTASIGIPHVWHLVWSRGIR